MSRFWHKVARVRLSRQRLSAMPGRLSSAASRDRQNWLCVRKGLVNVEAGLGEHDVVTAIFPEQGSEANLEFVGLAFGGGGM